MKNKPYLLAETTWKSVKDTEYEIAVLPWGATEAHNYHLPYSTDNIESDLIAGESARKAWKKGVRVVVLPNIPFGVNTGQADIKLDINLNPSTQLAMLNDVIASVERAGIRKFLVLNSHGGNDFRQMIRELGLKFPGMWILQANWYTIRYPEPLFNEAGDHAGEMETSLLMYLCPDRILPIEEAGSGKFKTSKLKGVKEGWAWTERLWPLVTEDTGIGDPRQATAEKGKKYFEYITDRIANLLEELKGLSRAESYE